MLWSPRSVVSRWVRAEVTIADRRKKLAPVTIEPCDRPIIFELTHTTDLSDWTGDTSEAVWQTFLRDIRRLIDRANAAESPSSNYGKGGGTGRHSARRFSKHLTNLDGGEAHSPRSREVGPEHSRPRPQPSRPAQVAGEHHQDGATQIFGRLNDLQGLADEFHCLEITSSGKLEQRFVISPLGLKIGRSAPADLILSDARVSRTHCMVGLADDRLRVSDLNSTNGTFIDGERIKGTSFLAVGSILKVGNVSFKHEVRSSAEV